MDLAEAIPAWHVVDGPSFMVRLTLKAGSSRRGGVSGTFRFWCLSSPRADTPVDWLP